MPGRPNPKAKVARLVLEARNDHEKEQIRKFKEVIREKGGIPILILLPEIEKHVKEHWPGNPQLQIPQFTGQLPLSRETKAKLKELWVMVPCPEYGGNGCRACAGIGK